MFSGLSSLTSIKNLSPKENDLIWSITVSILSLLISLPVNGDIVLPILAYSNLIYS